MGQRLLIISYVIFLRAPRYFGPLFTNPKWPPGSYRCRYRLVTGGGHETIPVPPRPRAACCGDSYRLGPLLRCFPPSVIPVHYLLGMRSVQFYRETSTPPFGIPKRIRKNVNFTFRKKRKKHFLRD